VAGSAPQVTGELERGRAAFDRHDWPAVIDSLGALDRQGALDGDDLERLGTALWWTGRPEESSDALERAFNAFETAGEAEKAAWAAMTLAYNAFRGLDGPVGGGWLARGHRILDDLPEGPMHARMAVFNALGALQAGDLETGVQLSQVAIDLATKYGEQSARAMATSFKGVGLLFLGRWKEGVRYIDEAAAAVASGTLDLRVASDIYCNTIGACRSVGDLERAGQWCDEGERWMRRNGSGGYPGVCRVHRAELKMLHGQWLEAEQEARQASEYLEKFRLLDGVGFAEYQVGEVRRRMGDLDGAAAAFDKAYEFGHDAQPGLALLQLERGNVEEARRSLGRALALTAPASPGDGEAGKVPGAKDVATRARLLPAQVELALASGDLDGARAAVEELESIAVNFERPVFRAGAMTARGELLLGEQRAFEASPVLGQSWRLWQTTDLPYEAALARLHYAEALAAEGDDATAKQDIRAARTVLERLGATREVQRADRLLGEDGAGAAAARGSTGSGAALKITRTFMFTDIVTSTDLVAAMGDDAWLELLRWHARELRDAIDKHAGFVVSDTGDGFFAAFERAGDAIEAAVDIQRRLARHRRDHGFAPSVRIGLHTAEAIREGGNYRGNGVHVAARVGAAAGREEILASESVTSGAGQIQFQLSKPRTLELKGVREPVEARSVAWR
jgi:class 3 adenylate cyclase